MIHCKRDLHNGHHNHQLHVVSLVMVQQTELPFVQNKLELHGTYFTGPRYLLQVSRRNVF